MHTDMRIHVCSDDGAGQRVEETMKITQQNIKHRTDMDVMLGDLWAFPQENFHNLTALTL